MLYAIDALDTLSFGIGKPAVRGEDTFGIGMFPPFPSVVRGAFRTAWLSGHIECIGEMDTEADPTKVWAITGYALSLNGVPHFPAPADTVFIKEGEPLKSLELRENDGLSSLSVPYQLWAGVDGRVSPPDKRYISLNTLREYLRGGLNDIPSVPLSDYISSESRIGIYRERETRAAEDAMLFRAPLTRTSGRSGRLEILVNIDGIDGVAERGLLRFGSHGKTASFRASGAQIAPELGASEGNAFKIYLATPAIFQNGWYPEIPGAELMTAAVSGYDSVGGFDIKKGRPKPMRRAVRAGSVYYYKCAGNADELFKLHGTSISNERAEDGFGICYIGR
ncbi:MAG: hypothetical protein LBI74_10125 [Synergistaceae bacterium]|jgi:CRISPR-associated protein Cmr3|nr:hypothetical protein [Synergistaceae bacterium]